VTRDWNGRVNDNKGTETGERKIDIDDTCIN